MTARPRVLLLVVVVGLMCGCRAKQEYSCAVRLNTSSGQVTLALNQAREWNADPTGSAFGAFEKTTPRAEAQCVSNVQPYLSATLTQQYPDGRVVCSCTKVDSF
jgi:hypothetical protein